MLNCFYDCYTILNKVYGEKAFLKQAINSTPLDSKSKTLTVKICYGVLDRDIELSYYISALTEKTPRLAIRTVLKIALYSIVYLNKRDYAVVLNAVELVKKLGKGGASGFVNAFLRKFLNDKPSLPSEGIKGLSLKYSYPEFAVKELIKDYGEDVAEKIMSSVNAKTCLAFYGEDGASYLNSLNKTFTKTPFDNVFLLDNFSLERGFFDGKYTVQALGSVAICDIVNPCENLLDLCAAPGGKSVRLSFKCDNVFACDIHEHRVKLIEEYAFRMKRKNVSVAVNDSTVINSDFINRFDAVLVDAPCSGFGVVNDNPDIKLNREEKDILSLIKTQKDILRCAAKYVKTGGHIYYSTCSVFFKENIEIINDFMSDVKGFEIVEISSPLPHFKVFNTIQFLPHISGGNGFYVAKLKRVF